MSKLLSKVINKHSLLNSVNLSFKNKIKQIIENIKKKKRRSLTSSINYNDGSSNNNVNNNNRTSYFHCQSDVILLVNWFLVICLLCDHLKLVQSRQLLCTPCEIKSEIGKKRQIGNSNDDDISGIPAKASYEEYVFEHQVTRQQAIDALRLLNDSFFNGPTDPGCKAFNCDKHLKYCLGAYFLNDHCFCEQSHSTEGLPFVPHSCYVGEENQATKKPSIGSCFRFAEIKDCCCIRPLAKRWKYLSSGTNISINILLMTCLLAFLIFFNLKLNFKIS